MSRPTCVNRSTFIGGRVDFPSLVNGKSRTDLGGVLVSVLGEDERWDGVDQVEAPDEAQPKDEGSGGSGMAVDGRSDPT